MHKPLILIGYRATGKTTLAKTLALRFGMEAVDSDVLIEQKAGKSIARIFAEEGEPTFRNWEAETIESVLKEANKGTGLILATGGGVVLRESTRNLLRKTGFVVWLKASPESIFQRMAQDVATASMRPGLTSLDARREITTLLKQRSPIYEETAHLQIDTNSVPPEKIVDTILENWKGCMHR